MRDHSASRLLIGERLHRITRSAKLERPDLLKVLALEEDLRSGHRVDRAAGQNRRSANERPDSVMGSPDCSEIGTGIRGHCEPQAAGRHFDFGPGGTVSSLSAWINRSRPTIVSTVTRSPVVFTRAVAANSGAPLANSVTRASRSATALGPSGIRNPSWYSTWSPSTRNQMLPALLSRIVRLAGVRNDRNWVTSLSPGPTGRTAAINTVPSDLSIIRWRGAASSTRPGVRRMDSSISRRVVARSSVRSEERRVGKEWRSGEAT